MVHRLMMVDNHNYDDDSDNNVDIDKCIDDDVPN